MRSFSSSNIIAFILCSALLISGCKKTDSSNNNNNNNSNNNNLPPAVTPVGIPLDDPVTKIIGPAGGSITSDDGVVELNIPAGALSSDTEIGIQPVTNQAPGGIGFSYHLLPDGTKFSSPATLIFHYTDQDISGSHPYLMYIAYQDNTNAWRADYINRDVDTVAKTASLAISHFSIWSVGEFLVLNADVEELRHDEPSHLRVEQAYNPPSEPSSGSQSGDELPQLPIVSPVEDKYVLYWRINGHGPNEHDGFFDGGGSHITYSAPQIIIEERTVQISAFIRFNAPMYNRGRIVSPVAEVILFKNIRLLPETYKFHLVYEYDKTFLGTIATEYSDKAEMDITVQGSDVIITNITNTPASVIPAFTKEGLCTNTYLPGPNGMINVTNAIGFVGTNPENKDQKVFEIRLAEDNCREPGWDFSCPPNSGVSIHIDPKPFNTTTGAMFILQNSDTTITYDPNGQEKTIYKLTHQ